VAPTLRFGVDLGGTKIELIALDAGGNEILRRRVPTPQDDYLATVAAVAALVHQAEVELGQHGSIGIGTPGAISPASGLMKNCNSTCLNGRPLQQDLERALNRELRLANDANCLALSEATYGSAAGAECVFGVILGTGVGGGLALGGELVQGGNGLSGEWGHVPLPYLRQWPFTINPKPIDAERIRLESALPDRRCYCGRLNCTETFLSGPGLRATHAVLWNEQLPAETIVRGENTQADKTLELYRHMLARSLAQVVNIVDPAVLVLGGGVSNAPGLALALEALIPVYAFSSVGGAGDVAVTVRVARWGDDSGVRGAARLWPAF
jgi:fructokinase